MLQAGDSEGRNQYGSLSTCLSEGAERRGRAQPAPSAEHITRNQRAETAWRKGCTRLPAKATFW